MSWIQSFKEGVKDEITAIGTRPWLWISGIVFPLFLMILLASSFSSGLMRNLPVGFVDYDKSIQVARLSYALESLPSIQLTSFSSTQEALEAMAANKTFATLVVPQDWSKKSAGARSDSAIELYLSKTFYAIATTLEIDIKKAFSALSVENLKRKIAAGGLGAKGAAYELQALNFDINTTGNTSFNYREYMLATFLPGVFSICIALTMVGVYVREWHEKNYRFWIQDGTSIPARILGKIFPWFVIYSLFALGYVAYFAGYLGNPPQGSLTLWCLGAVLLASAMMAIPLLIVSCSPSWIIALSVTIGCTAPIFPYTGFSYPLDAMSLGPNILSLFLPLTWFLRIQSCEWVLASSLAHSLYLIGILALFTIIPLITGLLLMSQRVNAWARKEEEPEKFESENLQDGFWHRAFSGIQYGVTHADTVIIFLVAIGFYLLFYAWPYLNQNITNVPTAIVDLDKSSASRSLIQSIDSMSAIKIKAVTANLTEGHNLYKNEKVDVVLVIPQDYEKNLYTNKKTTFGVTANGAFPVKARAAEVAFLSLLQEKTAQTVASNLLKLGAPKDSIKKMTLAPTGLVTEHRFNTLSGYASYTVPAVTSIIVQAVLLIAVVMTLGQWLHAKTPSKTLCRFLTSKKDYLTLLFGYSVFAFVWLLYAEGLDFSLFEFTSLANPSGSLLTMALFSLAIVAFGFALVLLLNSHIYGAQICVVASAPLFFISGLLFPTTGFGLLADVVRVFIPSTPGILALVAASQNGASTFSIAPHLCHLAVLILFYFFIGLRLARQRALERGLAC